MRVSRIRSGEEFRFCRTNSAFSGADHCSDAVRVERRVASARWPPHHPVAVTRLYAAIADTLLAAVTGTDHEGTDHGGTDHGAGLVVVEDVHWADSSSLGLLAYLVRRLAEWPLLLVLSWQSEQAGRLRVLRTALNEAEGQSLGQTVQPGPLGPEAIGVLLELAGAQAPAEREFPLTPAG